MTSNVPSERGASRTAAAQGLDRGLPGLQSIQKKLLAAFLLVAAMSVGSAAVAWLSVADSTAKLERVVENDLRAVAVAQGLANDVAVFSTATRGFAHVRSQSESARLVSDLEEHLEAMSDRIELLDSLGFDAASIATLRARITGLSVNLDIQRRLSAASIAEDERLSEAVSALWVAHRRFIEVAQPRIEAGYGALLIQGNRIITDLRDAATIEEGRDGIVDTVSRIGLDTLINRLAVESRANLEIVSAAHLVVGLLNEAANAADASRVHELRAQFSAAQGWLRRMQTDLGEAEPAGQQILEQAAPIFAFGTGVQSIFQLRLNQLGWEGSLARAASQSQHLASGLSSHVSSLVARASETAGTASTELSDSLWRARVVQTIAAALAVAVALLVGWGYVGRRVIGRLGALRSAMERQAQGQAAPIPVDGVDEIGAMARALTSFVDQRRQAEVALRVAKFEAEQANKAKSTFLAAMSHELRTPLNAVLGFSEMIRDRYYGPIGDVRYSEYAGDIYASGRYLLDLINDILDIAKIEAGKMTIAPEPIELSDLVSAALRLVGERAERSAVSLSTQLADGIPVLLADPRAIKQVLFNLLSNAIKFTDSGGQVAVQADSDAAGEWVEISVRDTGCGIPADMIETVFRPFERVDNGFDPSTERGTGLGLPLAKGLVELHGGTIAIASTVGAGTTVTVRLPTAARVPVTAQPGWKAPGPLAVADPKGPAAGVVRGGAVTRPAASRG